jgi:aminoglycoside phosphotransferase (APT) family kinase protein
MPSSASTTIPNPEWLTDVLRKNGCITDSNVIAIASQRIGAEIGFLDSLSRITLTYDRTEFTAPLSLVVKASSSDAIYQRIGNFYHAYDREFQFYEAIGNEAPIRLPRCYGREIDPTTDAHVLILEDMSSMTAGDQVQGLTPAQALAAIETIGQLHAAWWDQPRLESLSWMPYRNIQPSRYQAAWPSFRDLIGPQLSQSALALGEQLLLRLESLLQEMERRPHTIVHSDFRADNLLFDPHADAHPVVVLDWQLAIRGKGILDVARLLCGSLTPRDRTECEMDVVRRWHETLERGDVQGYSLSQAVEDYRTGSLLCLYYPVTIHAAEEAAGARGTALAHAQIERFFAAAMSLNPKAMG